jgi:hypothetical protein
LREFLHLDRANTGDNQAEVPLFAQQQSHTQNSCRPDDMFHSTAPSGAALARRCENALMLFAVMTLGQPLRELLSMGCDIQNAAPWDFVLSAASGESR